MVQVSLLGQLEPIWIWGKYELSVNWPSSLTDGQYIPVQKFGRKRLRLWVTTNIDNEKLLLTWKLGEANMSWLCK